MAAVEVSKTTLEINESMEIHFTGVADQVVVFTGDEDHVYQEYGGEEQKANTGVVMSKGLLTYSYTDPGVFHVVVIASTYDSFLGEGERQDKCEFDVMVIDDCTTIDKIYSSITPNVYYAEAVNDVDWVLRLPTAQMYNGREVALSPTRQRLTFDIMSDATEVYVNDVLWEARTYYDFTQVNYIHVVAYSGDTRDYRLYSIIYPEFLSLTIGGVEGVLSRNPYEQDLLTYTFTNAENTTDISYTIEDDVQFLVDGAAVGQGVDFSADREFTLRRANAENADISGATRVVFVFE